MTEHRDSSGLITLHAPLTQQLLDAAHRVHRTRGAGFLEKVYENALTIELVESGIAVQQQAPIAVRYRNHVAGSFVADLLMAGCVIVEIKAVEGLAPVHEVQLVNYLRATPIEVGLLINFSHRLTIKRRILTNDRKAAA